MTLLAAIVVLALAAYCGSRISDGFRTGEMQVIDRGIIPIVFLRKLEPILFWLATAFNAAITAALTGGGIVLLVQGLRK